MKLRAVCNTLQWLNAVLGEGQWCRLQLRWGEGACGVGPRGCVVWV